MNWTEATAQAPWHGRSGHVAETFADRLWVLGGGYSVGSGRDMSLSLLNDVWSTVNGSTWAQAQSASWKPRAGHCGAVFDGKLWIMAGGVDNGNGGERAVNDVWYMTANDATVRIDGSHDGWCQVGGPLSLQAVSTGLSNQVTYQWLKDGQPIPAATTDRYAVDQVALSDAGSYTCQVTDAVNALTLTASPVQISVFPAGSLPLGNWGVIVAAIVFCAFVRAFFKRKNKS